MKPTRHSFHKRLALHPLTVMMLLCLGVFIVGSTFRASADELQVTATVHAAPLTSPAIITSHYDQQHVTEAQATVAGTCPADSYVRLFQNDAFVGVAQCQSGTFSIPAVFTPGANKLQVKAYNITDDEGPVEPAITVYYERASVTPQVPPSVPTDLSVTTVEGVIYRPNVTFTTSNRPTFTGLAPPGSRVTVAIGTSTCLVTANTSGWWGCTFAAALPDGVQAVEVSGVAPDGRAMSFPTFYIRVTPGVPPLLQGDGDIKPLHIEAAYRYQARPEDQEWHWDVRITGGAPPYKVTVDWGDGTITNRDRSDSEYFTISHIYNDAGVYHPTIRVVDNGGQSNRLAVMQLLAIVKPHEPVAAAATKPIDAIGDYLWIIWPTYGAIVLMVVSFWLGEMELARRFRLRRH